MMSSVPYVWDLWPELKLAMQFPVIWLSVQISSFAFWGILSFTLSNSFPGRQHYLPTENTTLYMYISFYYLQRVWRTAFIYTVH